MKVMLLLADSAQVTPDGAKVHALGLGWDLTGSPTAPMAVVALIQVPWHETNLQHHFVIMLRDVQGFPSEEVCELLSLTPENQRVLLHRGRAKVRAALEGYFRQAVTA